MLVVAAFLFYIVVCCERYMEAVAALDPWCTVHYQRRHQVVWCNFEVVPFRRDHESDISPALDLDLPCYLFAPLDAKSTFHLV